MMLPTLISVSLAPGSYFFCASAGDAIATSPAAMETNTRLFTGIALSLFSGFPTTLRWLNSIASDFAVQHRAERLERFAGKARHLHLLDREEVGCAGVELYSGQEHPELDVLQAGGLLHHVGAGEIVAALLENLHHGLRDEMAVDGEDLGGVRVVKKIFHEGEPLQSGGIVPPGRIGR